MRRFALPTFTKMSIAQAQAKSATGKRAALLQQYMVSRAATRCTTAAAESCTTGTMRKN